MIETVPRAEWLAKHRTVRTLFHQITKGIRVLDSANIWPESALLTGCDAHQRAQWDKATAGTIGILGGSPGTGKTFTVAAGVKALLESGIVSADDIAIGCPTGKAAVRLTEQLQAAGLSMRARTWHSILGLGKGEKQFAHDQSNPLPFRVLISDESSMINTGLMAAIFAARPRGCHVLLVGDVNQLPPVEHGAPLRDLIAAGLPYGELTEIKRNSGGIVEACAAIREGKPWQTGSNLKLLITTSPEDQMQTIIGVLAKASAIEKDPIWDCQVLVAVNDKSKVSRKRVNEVLQEILNPQGYWPKGSMFRVGDKVVNTKNAFHTASEVLPGDGEGIESNDRGEVYVANGELGEVVSIDDKSMLVSLTGPARVVRVPIGGRKVASESSESSESVEESTVDSSASTGCSWDLGYALSVHKAQGSEVPIAIVVLDDYPGARQVCDRSWLYTAISRAKEKCVLVGTKQNADAMCRRVNVGLRKTFLREAVLMGLADRAIDGL